MKKFIVESPKHGRHEVLVDDGDYEWLSKYVWCVYKGNGTYYAAAWIYELKKVVRMHRFIMGTNNPRIFVDHIDHCGCNNQRANLRECNNSQNHMNAKKRKGSNSEYLGVFIDRKKRPNGRIHNMWYAKTSVRTPTGREQRYSKLFPFTEEGEKMAAMAYDEMAKEQYGDFANLNFKD